MAVEQKQSTLLEEAQSRLSQLSPEQLQVAVAILAYLQETEENKATQELSSIPGLAASFREAVQKKEIQPLNAQEQATVKSNNNKVEERIQDLQDTMTEKGVNLTAEDLEGLRSYLVTKPQWEEVYRRLANS